MSASDRRPATVLGWIRRLGAWIKTVPRATSGVKAHTLSVAWTTRLNAVKNGGAMTAPPFASELARKMQLT